MTTVVKISKLAFVVILLIFGLYISYDLQKDFLIELGFSFFAAVASFVFFDASKIAAEILIFRSRWAGKIFYGVYVLLLILVSVYVTLVVRLWKSDDAFNEAEKTRTFLVDKSSTIQKREQDLLKSVDFYKNQIKELDKQIGYIQDEVMPGLDDLPKYLYDKRAKQYNDDVSTKQKQKSTYVEKLIEVEKSLQGIYTEQTDIVDQKAQKTEVRLIDTVQKVFGVNAKEYLIIVNFMLALLLEATILFLCSMFSKTLSTLKDTNPVNPSPSIGLPKVMTSRPASAKNQEALNDVKNEFLLLFSDQLRGSLRLSWNQYTGFTDKGINVLYLEWVEGTQKLTVVLQENRLYDWQFTDPDNEIVISRTNVRLPEISSELVRYSKWIVSEDAMSKKNKRVEPESPKESLSAQSDIISTEGEVLAPVEKDIKAGGFDEDTRRVLKNNAKTYYTQLVQNPKQRSRFLRSLRTILGLTEQAFSAILNEKSAKYTRLEQGIGTVGDAHLALIRDYLIKNYQLDI